MLVELRNVVKYEHIHFQEKLAIVSCYLLNKKRYLLLLKHYLSCDVVL